MKHTSTEAAKNLSDLLSEILSYLSPIYREAEKELSTANILTPSSEKEDRMSSFGLRRSDLKFHRATQFFLVLIHLEECECLRLSSTEIWKCPECVFIGR